MSRDLSTQQFIKTDKTVLLVSNIDPVTCSCKSKFCGCHDAGDVLYVLFGIYAEVLRVKVLLLDLIVSTVDV